MQNRYFGDIGDFGKYGLLRRVCAADEHGNALRLGVLWYLVPDESHTNDGMHVGYLSESTRNTRLFRACDRDLWDGLKADVDAGERHVALVRERGLLPADTVYHEKKLSWPAEFSPNSERGRAGRLWFRQLWWQEGFDLTAPCDAVFLDPDIGLEVKVQKYGGRAGKYVFWDEVVPYWRRGQSIIIYQHNNRNGPAVEQARKRLAQAHDHTGSDEAFALFFRRGTLSIFIIISQPHHAQLLRSRVNEMLAGPWGRHFELVENKAPQVRSRKNGSGPRAPMNADEDVSELARLVRTRNEVSAEIAALIGRPAQIGHIGEYIAARVFDIDLHASAVTKASDGVFRSGPLAGRTVNIKLYGKCEGLLDIREDALPDCYLVLTGPKVAPGSSRGQVRPWVWVITHVFLFEAAPLVADLRKQGARIGIATSVRKALWEAAEIYPAQNASFPLSDEQRASLAIFS